MRHSFWAGTTAAIAIFAGSAAFADVTAEEVWANWKDMVTSSGGTVATVSEARDGATLKISGMTVSSTGEQGGYSVSIDQIDLTENGDGTVKVTTSESIPMLFKSAKPADGAQPADMQVDVTTAGMVLTASGTADALKYDFAATTLGAKVHSINGAEAAANDLNLDFTLSNVAGNELVEGEAGHKTVAANFTADTMALTATAKDAEKGSDMNITAEMTGISSQNSTTMVDMTDMVTALAAGFAINTSFSYTGSTFDMTVTEASGPTKVTGTTGAGDLTMALDKAHLKYSGNAKAAAFSLSSPQIPFPQVDVSYEETGFNLDMPTAKSDAPVDFTFLTKIVGLDVSDELWSMVDPTAALPHDGVTLIIDTKGKATMKTDLFSPENMANVEGDTPTPPKAELNALDLTELKLSVAGAELTGAGTFTFDNTDMTTFEGMPLPSGKIDLKLTGANGLLDKIVTMGYLTAEDVMGYKMMAGMFTVATPDADELTSTLEFKDKGFYANGQKLQ